MKPSIDKFSANDGTQIAYYHWKTLVVPCKGVVQIAHGIGEHTKRYQRIATILQEEGFDVYGNDHRAHGKSVKTEELFGYYEGDNYFEDAVNDMYQLTLLIKKEHPQEKIILFGHSMGSLLSRQYVTKYGHKIDALILSGTASYMKGLGFVGLTAANIVSAFIGRKRENHLLKEAFFGEFNRKFKPNRTKLDWLTRDEHEVDIFEADPYRIEDFSVGIFIDLIKSSKLINSATVFKSTPKQLPIYIFSGDKDPVGEMGKGVKKVYKQYKKAGIKNLTLKLYKDGRHEMLNEINKQEVEQDVLLWLNNTLN